MVFGLSPRHIQELPLDGLTQEQFLVLAIEAAKKLEWSIGYTNETGFIAYTEFSISSWSEEIKVKIDGDKASLKSGCIGSQMVDWGKNKKNIENVVAKFNEIKSSFTNEELKRKYEELKPGLFSNENDVLDQATTSNENFTGFLSIFKPAEGYFITPILINLNIAIFILMIMSGVNFILPDNESLIKWGANFRPATLDGGLWRLITSCFLHIGILHLLLNMFALFYIGLLLEPHIGRIRITTAYLLTGVSASITSLWWHDNTISAGASGAIFGLYGVFIAMLTTNLIEKSKRKALLTSITVFVGYNLISGLRGEIDNAAHIGGLFSGLVIGFSFVPSLKEPEAIKMKYSIVVVLTVLVLSTSFIISKKLTIDMGQYNERMNSFVSMESMALEVYHMSRNTPKDKLLSEIKDRGIYYWNENTKLLNELEELNLPDNIHERNRILLDYCELRIKCYTLIYKAIEEDTDNYKDSIEIYNTEIEAIVNSLTEK